MLYEGVWSLSYILPCSGALLRFLLLFPVALFIKLEEILILETPIALSDLAEIG